LLSGEIEANFTVFAEGIAVFSPGRKVWEGR